MRISVYSGLKSRGFLRAFRGVVYRKTVDYQGALRNHNPRVGGSSPSSATIYPNRMFLGRLAKARKADTQLYA